MSKFYLTTSIPYANAEPHLGHALELVGTDVLARTKRMLGYDVYFQTGTDEHGQKMLEAAAKAGRDPAEYANEIVPRFREIWDGLHISHDYFIRSSDEEHKAGVAKFWRAVRDRGDIYLGRYEGLYSLSEEAFYLESQARIAPDGRKLSPETGEELVARSEESYFFRWSRYQDELMRLVTGNPDFIAPPFRANEMINSFLKPGLQDISISRTSMSWGIPVPDDPKHVIYVWFDALVNYITGAGYGTDEARFAKWWPADVHIVGKDIVKFHTLLWPAMLMSAGLEPPRRVYIHGFVSQRAEGGEAELGETVEWRVVRKGAKPGAVVVAATESGEALGEAEAPSDNPAAVAAALVAAFGARVQKLEKMSKSKGNVVSPRDVLARFGGNPDPLRFFLMREMDFGHDGIYADDLLDTRYNADLVNGIGNLTARTLAMVEKYRAGEIAPPAAGDAADDLLRDTVLAVFADAPDGWRALSLRETGGRWAYQRVAQTHLGRCGAAQRLRDGATAVGTGEGSGAGRPPRRGSLQPLRRAPACGHAALAVHAGHFATHLGATRCTGTVGRRAFRKAPPLGLPAGNAHDPWREPFSEAGIGEVRKRAKSGVQSLGWFFHYLRAGLPAKWSEKPN